MEVRVASTSRFCQPTVADPSLVTFSAKPKGPSTPSDLSSGSRSSYPPPFLPRCFSTSTASRRHSGVPSGIFLTTPLAPSKCAYQLTRAIHLRLHSQIPYTTEPYAGGYFRYLTTPQEIFPKKSLCPGVPVEASEDSGFLLQTNHSQGPCPHSSSWKILRSKRGFLNYACATCGAKWKIAASMKLRRAIASTAVSPQF